MGKYNYYISIFIKMYLSNKWLIYSISLYINISLFIAFPIGLWFLLFLYYTKFFHFIEDERFL